ncbi:spectrin binding [Trichomonas vaginalis G3]|uniref:spectrin binding n=1 Tax=Trichomonas vaginalis (strain ATCC PRA-98 / G3) TaxID=412133 RepID=UPI0021E567C8|nr:spectrin binding [Trichomonas vaginalis G3]KAI5489287.1 spectrin binding [Trichomonas vaginalis G3]
MHRAKCDLPIDPEIDAKSKEDNLTALMIAARNGNYDLSKTLLINGANPNITNKSGSTAILYPIAKSLTDLTDLFLLYNPDLTIVNDKGKDAFSLAIEKNNKYIISLVVHYLIRSTKFSQNKYFLHEEYQSYFNSLISFLRSQSTNEKLLLLEITINNGDEEYIKFFMKFLTDVNQDHIIDLSRHIINVLETKNTDIVKTLVKIGFDFNKLFIPRFKEYSNFKLFIKIMNDGVSFENETICDMIHHYKSPEFLSEVINIIDSDNFASYLLEAKQDYEIIKQIYNLKGIQLTKLLSISSLKQLSSSGRMLLVNLIDKCNISPNDIINSLKEIENADPYIDFIRYHYKIAENDLFQELELNSIDLTPLELAILSNNYEMTKYLLDHGKQVTSNEFSLSKSKEITKLLILYKPRLDDGSIINQLYENQDIESIQFLYSENPNMNPFLLFSKSIDDNNITFLHEIIKLHFDINCRNIRNETPLHYSVLHNNSRAVEVLLHNSANPNLCDFSGNTVLNLCSINKEISIEITQLILQYYPNPNIANLFGNTVLHSCALSDNVDVYDLVTGRYPFIDLYQMNFNQATPMALAKSVGSIGMMKMFNAPDEIINGHEDYGPKPLFQADISKFITMRAFGYFKFYLENHKNVNVDKKNGMGETPLYVAASADNSYRFIDLLGKYGADPNIECGGKTPLRLAIENRFYGNYEALIRNSRLNINKQFERGINHFQIAIRCNCLPVLYLLYDKKFDIEMKTKKR